MMFFMMGFGILFMLALVVLPVVLIIALVAVLAGRKIVH